MEVFTFVVKFKGGEWSAKQHGGDLEACAPSSFELQRKLVQAALSSDSSGAVQSSYSPVTSDSAVFQVIIGAAAPSSGGVAASSSGGAAAPQAEAPTAEEKKKEEESDDECGIGMGGLFD